MNRTMRRIPIIALTIAALVLAIPTKLFGQDLPEETVPVTRAEVWRAIAGELRTLGFNERAMPADTNLELPVAVPALPGHRLQVTSACWDNDLRRMTFRLQCAGAGQCLPFLAYLPETSIDHEQGTESCRSGMKPNTTDIAKSPAKPDKAHNSTRPGMHATAVFTAANLRMTTSVVCLDRGREGDVIHVRGENGRIFRARIIGAAQLEALP